MCIKMPCCFRLNITGNDYVLGDKKLKAISVSASKDNSGAVHISLVNIDATHEQELTIEMGEIIARHCKRQDSSFGQAAGPQHV